MEEYRNTVHFYEIWEGLIGVITFKQWLKKVEDCCARLERLLPKEE